MSQLRSGGAVVGGGSRQSFMSNAYYHETPPPQPSRFERTNPLSHAVGWRRRVIAGVTRDGAGAALASCVVQLFRTASDAIVAELTSDGAGSYEHSVYDDAQYYLVAYKAGSPDVTGATLNTVTGS